MKNAILLHGRPTRDEYYNPSRPSSSNAHWFPWLQKQLIINDIKADAPEIPSAFDPQYDLWVKEVERFDITPETIVVGHSCGAGFWIKYLSLNKDLRVGKVVLVAPWLGKEYDEPPTNFFENYTIDPDLLQRTQGLVILFSDDDHAVIQDAVEELRQKVKGASYREFHNYGHFTFESMKTTIFPELLEEVIHAA